MMKTIGGTIALLLFGIAGSLAADRPPLDPKPLPPGPILSKAPDFSSWQITFTYSPPGQNGSAASATSKGPTGPGSTLPVLLTVTRTKPEWHAALTDASGNKKEVWYNGDVRFVVGPKPKDLYVIGALEPGYSNPYLEYGSGPDFPDMNWVSPQTYLGTQTGTTLWVFQQEPQRGHGMDRLGDPSAREVAVGR